MYEEENPGSKCKTLATVAQMLAYKEDRKAGLLMELDTGFSFAQIFPLWTLPNKKDVE